MNRLDFVIHGALAGANAASGMTILRMLARRAGWLDTMVPQAVEQWLRERVASPSAAPSTQTLADHAIHIGYGMLWGAAYGAICGSRTRGVNAVTLGLAQWMVGPMGVLPLLRIARPPWRESSSALWTNVIAHALYAELTDFLLKEFTQQASAPTRRVARLRHAASIG